MSLEMAPRQRLEQRMHLSQQMLQNLELLLLPALDLRDLLQKELQENPVLEEGPAPDGAASSTAEEEETPEAAARREMLEAVEDQWIESERRTRRSNTAEDAERRMEMLNNCSDAGPSLKEHLSDQLRLLDLPEEMRVLCGHVIEHVEESGLLKTSIEDMVTSLPEELLQGSLELLAKEIRSAVRIIQSLEPRGVGAGSIRECLLLQLDPSDPLAPVLRRFIERHLDDVSANRLPRIVRSMIADPVLMKDLGREGEPDVSAVLEDVKQLIAEIANLNPTPGARYSSEKASRVYPEVLIRRVDGRLEIILEDGWLPAISINRTYEEMIQDRVLKADEKVLAHRMAGDGRHSAEDRRFYARLASGRKLPAKDRARCGELVRTRTLAPEETRLLASLSEGSVCAKGDREFIKHKVDAGRKLIAAIEQRRGTLYRVTEQILRRQAAFFENGIEHLRPLKMQEIADAVGIHLSTVSRAVSEKWMETPQGILPFRFFFATGARGTDRSTPEAATRPALLDKVRDILETEDRTHPHSDLEIARILNREYRVSAARRTVAKYREELRFPAANLRKCH